jgi:hypothetical protein
MENFFCFVYQSTRFKTCAMRVPVDPVIRRVFTNGAEISDDNEEVFCSRNSNICPFLISDEFNTSSVTPDEINYNNPRFLALELIDGIDCHSLGRTIRIDA